MNDRIDLSRDLIELDDSLLILVDVQELFLAKLLPAECRPLLNRILWIVQVAGALGVPMLVTAEDISQNGTVVAELEAVLPEPTTVFDKLSFALTGDERIQAEIDRSGRRTHILAGLETDVCVAQSALGLLRQGYHVAVLADATASPGIGQEVGLERMRRAGILISTVKSLYYEWVRTVQQDNLFRSRWPQLFQLPDGISL